MQGHGFRTGPSGGRDLGPADLLQQICKEWVQKLGFNGATAYAEAGDDQVGANNIESDGPTTRGKGLLVRGYEFPSSLTPQEPHRVIPPTMGDL